jgi:hypothetical protein
VWIVGLVAGVAGHAAGVLSGYHLRKTLWLRRVFLVAAAAEVSDLRQLWNVGRWVIGVLRQGTMASFAGYVRVSAGGSGFNFVVVTESAGILTGEGYRMLANQLERPRPVVSILPKCFGDDGAANDEEDDKTGKQNCRRANQVSGIAEQAAQTPPPFPEQCGTGNMMTKSPCYVEINDFARQCAVVFYT